MKIGLFQYSPVWESKEESKTKIKALLESSSFKGELLIFPEMTLTGFTMNPVPFAESLDGLTFDFAAQIAVSLNCNIFFGLITVNNGKFFNTLLHIDSSGKLVCKYDKFHPFSYAKENLHYSRGEKTIITKIGDLSIGLSICYDLRFPELYRLYAKEKVQLIVDIANWPVQRIEHWKALIKARAIENQCYFAACNRVGSDPLAVYNGFSTVTDPLGNIIAENENNETIVEAVLNLEELNSIRNRLPFLQDIYLI